MSLYLWFTLMIIVSALWLIWFVNRPLNDKQLNLEQSNIDLGKQRLLELEQDLAQNLIDQEQFEQAKKEVSQTLAVELDQAHSQYKNSSNIWVIVVTLVLLPVMSIGIYQHLTPEVSTTVEIQQPPSALETSAIQIKQHLVDNPNDFECWQLLGLT